MSWFVGARSRSMSLLLAVAATISLGTPGRDVARAATKQPGTTGDSWPEVTAEERKLTRVEQDPDADAVVLINERSGKILQQGSDIVNVIDQHVRFKILNDRGKRYGEMAIRAAKYSRVSNITARTIRPDGTIVPVTQDQIFEKVVFQAGDYKETAWVFNFPAVEPGAILEYRYDRHDDSLVFLDPFYFAGPEFTLKARVTQAIPEDMGYSLLCDLCPRSQPPTVTNWRDGKAKGKLYSQELHDLPGYRKELLMPPPRDVTPRLEMVLSAWNNHFDWALGRQDRFFIDWPSVALYASSYYQAAVKNGLAALRPVVEGWVRGMADPQDKIKAILRHVQRDFRYLSFTYVTGHVRPIEMMLKGKIADNEDKGVLLIAALKTIGIDAYPTLVSGRDGGSLNPKFFSLSQFTHTVVALPQAGGAYQFLDPTVTFVPFGFVPWKDSGAEGLLLKGTQGEMLTLPVKNELSVGRYRVTVRPHPDGRADLVVEGQFFGEDAADLREDLAPASEVGRKSYLEEWVGKRRPGATLASYSIENLEDPDQPLLLKMSIESPGLVTKADQVELVKGCVLTCVQSNPVSRGGRQYPFYVDRGWNEDETVVVEAPEGMAPAQMPKPVVAKSALGSFSLSCMAQGDGSIRCSRQFAARRTRLPESEQAGIRAMFDQIVEGDRTTVAFQNGGTAQP